MRKAKAMHHFPLLSGRLLSALGASLLCSMAAQQAHSGRQAGAGHGPARGAGPKQVVLVSNKRGAAPRTQAETPKLQVGDLTISGATKSEGVLGTGALRWTGPNTEIEVPDRASKSVLRVHADDIQASRVGKNQFGLITFSGSVRYRLTQQTDAGERILEGTAGRAEVRRVARYMEFTGGVHAKLTDAARFNGPATLHTGSLTLAMDSRPFRYTLEGAAAGNDIQFTPLQSAAAEDGAKATSGALGTIHLFGFRSGDLQFGQAVHLQGAGTTCEFASPDDKTAWRLRGEQFEGEFVPDRSDIQRATVTQNVRFRVKQPSADKKSFTTADGTAPQASYVRSQAGQELVAHGPFKIDFSDPEHSEEPITLTAGQSSILTVKKSDNSLSYALDDPNHTQKFHIVPKPFDVKEAKPTTLPVPK